MFLRFGTVVGLADIGVFEHVAPEGCQLVRIVDFNDIELLNDVLVQMQLLFFEHRDDSVSKVDSNQVHQLVIGFDVTVALNNKKDKTKNITDT